jgi:hypothetical protein
VPRTEALAAALTAALAAALAALAAACAHLQEGVTALSPRSIALLLSPLLLLALLSAGRAALHARAAAHRRTRRRRVASPSPPPAASRGRGANEDGTYGILRSPGHWHSRRASHVGAGGSGDQ